MHVYVVGFYLQFLPVSPDFTAESVKRSDMQSDFTVSPVNEYAE